MSNNLSEANCKAGSDGTPELPAMVDETYAERLRAELIDTAHGEWLRQRRRLDELTPDQEHALGVLLMSVTDRISHLLYQQMLRSLSKYEAKKEGALPSQNRTGI